ncbi:cyanophycinase [Thermaurantiacus sp.]
MQRAFAAVIALVVWAPAVVAGPLVIAGGAIAEDNAAVIRAVLDRRPQNAPAIAIIPAASAAPAEALARSAALFQRHGALPEDIVAIRLAVVDDPTTAEDEADWAARASDPQTLALLEGVGAIWFTGGDQSRIMAALVAPDGRATPLLAAIRARHRAGAVVGGTSAGAAVMSDPMLTGGDPVAAVSPGRGEAVTMAAGLGFLAGAIVDQHFDARSRLPRLLAALASLPPRQRLGFGIDEDTALIVSEGTAMVAGRGLVTFVDGRRARLRRGPGVRATGLALHLMAEGDVMPLPAKVGPAAARRREF